MYTAIELDPGLTNALAYHITSTNWVHCKKVKMEFGWRWEKGV